MKKRTWKALRHMSVEAAVQFLNMVALYEALTPDDRAKFDAFLDQQALKVPK